MKMLPEADEVETETVAEKDEILYIERIRCRRGRNTSRAEGLGYE